MRVILLELERDMLLIASDDPMAERSLLVKWAGWGFVYESGWTRWPPRAWSGSLWGREA